MIQLIFTITLLGLLVWAIVTYIPMPELFKKAIMVIAVICLILYLIGVFGIADIPIPRLRR
jgi:hypothetical protein